MNISFIPLPDVLRTVTEIEKMVASGTSNEPKRNPNLASASLNISWTLIHNEITSDPLAKVCSLNNSTIFVGWKLGVKVVVENPTRLF